MNGVRPGSSAACGMLFVLATLLAAAGCATAKNPPGPGPRTVVDRGHTAGGLSWQLTGWEQDGQLSLELDSPSGHSYSGARGFAPGPSAGYWAEGGGPGNSIFYYGPVPSAATMVRLSAPGYHSLLVRTGPIPSRDGLPHGRFFILAPPGPANVNWTVTPLNTAGQKVPFRSF
jgi:hypothetical protein